MLILEGLLPFLAPRGWRQMFEKIPQMSDGQIRFFGLCFVVVGVAGVYLLA
jgi:hypothetical protein